MKIAMALITIACAAAQPQSDLGVYLGWVASYPGDRLAKGAELAKSSGFHTIRLPLIDPGPRCGRSLAEVAALPEYARILGDPAFSTIFLTTWGDSHSYNPCRPRDPRTDQHPGKVYLRKSYYSSENRDRMRAEYSDLTFLLYKTYRASGKTFAISNWEGDNEIYCDAAGYFVTDPSFRAACERERSTADAVDAYREYLMTRHEGVDAGRDRAGRAGFEKVSVVDMMEFSSLRLLKDHGLPDVLDDVIPSVPASGFVSYSAWESLGDHLRDDLEVLEKRFGEHLVVGEFGFDRGLDLKAPDRVATTIETIREVGVRFGVVWQIFDQPPLEGLGDMGLYGLYDEKGRLTPVGMRVLNK